MLQKGSKCLKKGLSASTSSFWAKPSLSCLLDAPNKFNVEPQYYILNCVGFEDSIEINFYGLYKDYIGFLFHYN